VFAITIGGVEWRLAERPVFSVAARIYRWRDVLHWAEQTGELGRLEEETRAGIAALEQDGPPTAADVGDAATAFRYARSLLAAEEMEAWLTHWELTTADWMGHVRRVVARERRPTPQSHAAVRVGDELRVDGICSGAFGRFARELAVRVALAPDGDLESGFERFRAAVTTPEAIAREIESRRLDWLRVEGEQLAVADEDVAREVVLSVREDGEALADVAQRARGELRPLATYLDDAEPELAAVLLGARENEVLGPVPVGDRFIVAVARRKAPPTPEDAVLRDRAAELVCRRAIARQLETHVRWHERL
jgi:hypothetical protein